MIDAEKGDLVIVQCCSRATSFTPGENTTFTVFRCGTVSKVDNEGVAIRIKIAGKTHAIRETPGYQAHHIVPAKDIDVIAALAALRKIDLDSLATIRDTIRPFLRGGLEWQKNHRG